MAATDDRRKQVMVGALPDNFLRVGATPEQQQIAADEQTAQMLQAQQAGVTVPGGPAMARLTITITQAKLTKNYGVMKMDPYCRVRVGHSVFETHTAHSGGKNPRWNKSLHCHLPAGVDSLYIEIFDERAFTMDNRIGWAHVSIPERLLEGETIDDWYSLNGKQGDGKEGMINLIMSYSQRPVMPPVVYTAPMQPVVMVPTGMPMYYPPQQQMAGVPVTVAQPQQPQGPLFTEADVQQIKEVVPNMDEEVIRSVLEANRGNKDRTINNLLSMDS